MHVYYVQYAQRTRTAQALRSTVAPHIHLPTETATRACATRLRAASAIVQTGSAYHGRMSRLAQQIKEALAGFDRLSMSPALIGGLALASHRVVRATRSVDFLVDAADADRLHELLLTLGYTCIHRSDDAANYVRDDEGFDVLYAQRPEARRLLAEASERSTPFGHLRVISAEGLIAFKLQSLVNDPSRGRDLDDIRALLKTNVDTLDMVRVRRYFALFERQDLLEQLIEHT